MNANESELLDRMARILATAPDAAKGFLVHRRAPADEFFALQLRGGRLFNVTIQEVRDPEPGWLAPESEVPAE